MNRRLLPLLLALLIGTPAFATRNSSGTYTLPAGNPVTTHTTITSTWANSTLLDIANTLTASLDRSGNGPMLAPLQLASGTISAPGLTWSSDPGSGLYRAGANDYRMSVAATDVMQWTNSSVTSIANFTASGTATFNNGAVVSAPSTNVVALQVTGDTAGDSACNITAGTSTGAGTWYAANFTGGNQNTAGNAGGRGITAAGGAGNGSGAGGRAAAFVGGTAGATGVGGIGLTASGAAGGATSGAGGIGASVAGGAGTASNSVGGDALSAVGGAGAGSSAGGNGGSSTGGRGGATGAGGFGLFGTGGNGGATSGNAGDGVKGQGGAGTAGNGNGGNGLQGIGGAANGSGTPGSGVFGAGAASTTAVGGFFQSGTAATAATRQDAITAANGDLNMSGVALASGTGIWKPGHLLPNAIPTAIVQVNTGASPTLTTTAPRFGGASVSCATNNITVTLAGTPATATFAFCQVFNSAASAHTVQLTSFGSNTVVFSGWSGTVQDNLCSISETVYCLVYGN